MAPSAACGPTQRKPASCKAAIRACKCARGREWMSGFIRLLAFRYPPRVVAACPARTCRYAHATSAILFTHSHPLLPLEGGRNEADSGVTYIHHLGRQTRMCLGIPMQITAIDGHRARCEAGGIEREVSLFLLQDSD